MNWILIGAIIVIGFVMFKFKEVRHKTGHWMGIALIIFLVVTLGTLYASHNLDLTSVEGIVETGKLYFHWLGQATSNIFKLSGYATKQDWSFNITNLTR